MGELIDMMEVRRRLAASKSAKRLAAIEAEKSMLLKNLQAIYARLEQLEHSESWLREALLLQQSDMEEREEDAQSDTTIDGEGEEADHRQSWWRHALKWLKE